MLNQEERAAKFFDAITKDAEERHEEMTRKTRETVESGLEKAKTKAHSQAQAKIERERMLKEQEFNRTVANERTQQRARLTDKRGAITDEVFGDAREKLTAFTESDGYADFLKKSAAGFAAVFPQGDVTVYVRPGDMRFADDIKKAFGRDCKVESSDEITIGGCRAGGVGDLENLIDKTMEHFGGKFDFMLHSIGMSPNVRKGRTYDDLDYDFLSKTLDISAISFHKAIQVARKKDAINDWGSIVALSYIAAQRTLYGYNDMADAKALLESIARSFGYIYGREKHVRINTVSQSPTPTTAGSGVLGLGDLMGFAENMSPLGNASAEDCADYVLTLFSDLTRKVTMQNLYHDGGFSSMGMSRRAMKTYEKGMRFEDVHENQYPFGK